MSVGSATKQRKATKRPAPANEPPHLTWRPEHWALAAIVVVAFGLRVYDLERIPIAGDESVYLRWAEIIVHQKQFFISLLDGKQPLSYWLYALTRLVWEDDPLFGPRLISALAGTFSALGIFALGRRLAGWTGGLVAAALYAVFPYALLYDRLAYTESLVNLAGVAIVWASLACFGEGREGWKPAVPLGLALGLGFFIKSTAALFAFFPVVAVLWLKGPRRLVRLGVAYGIAAVFPLLAWAAVPRAPMMQTHNLLVHQTSFFVPPRELLSHPLAAAPANLRALAAYTGAYLTWPLAAAGLAALGYLAWKRSRAALAVASVALLPLAVQVFILLQRPSRYLFPHFWPWLVLIGMATEALWQEKRLRPWTLVALAAVSVPAAVTGLGVVRNPQEWLDREDAQTFTGSGPAAGYGIADAAGYLVQEARRQGPLVVFTDPIWGPPADAIFAYVNGREGIRAYEAWWTTIAPDYPIVPPARVEVLKSQYERVAAGTLDPRDLRRVYYVTETQYTPAAVVAQREPRAQRVAAFVKPNGRNAIEVYRLR